MKSEKVSINVNNDKLAAIDLLVEEGLVANRSAFINEAIDLLIQREQKKIDDIIIQKEKTISNKQWFIGIKPISVDYLLMFKKNGIKLSLNGFGSLYLSQDIDVELIDETIESISKKIRIHGTIEQVNALIYKIK